MAAISLEHVSKRYAGVTALDAVSLSFPAHLITAVIGPSGCGKSTLIRLCNGLVRPDAGQVSVLGRPMDYANLPALRRRLGYAVQGTGLFPHLTARENITLLAALEGWPAQKIANRLEELIVLSHLQGAELGRFPHQLSGGQQQRVGLCRAMMLRPAVLLLDEPFAAIDPITRADIHRQLLAMHGAEPVSAVLVTHDMREALLLADHVVVLAGGRLVCSESKSALMARREAASPERLLASLLGGATC